MARLSDQCKEDLFKQAQTLRLRESVFQSSEDVTIKDLIFELTEIDDLRNKQAENLNQYASFIRILIRKMILNDSKPQTSRSTSVNGSQ